MLDFYTDKNMRDRRPIKIEMNKNELDRMIKLLENIQNVCQN